MTDETEHQKHYLDSLKAVEQHRAREPIEWAACGCLGPQLLPGETTKGPDGYTDVKLLATAKVYLDCPCGMRMIEEVNGKFFRIEVDFGVPSPDYSATYIGEVGGPYKTGV